MWYRQGWKKSKRQSQRPLTCSQIDFRAEGREIITNTDKMANKAQKDGRMSELEQMRKITVAYEEKLVQLMGVEAFGAFAVEVGKMLFGADVEGMPEGDFREFVLKHFDEITR